VVLQTGASLTGDYPTQDVSSALTEYPGDLLSSPLDTRSVTLTFDAGSAPMAPSLPEAAVAVSAPQRSGAGFASLINTDDLTIGAVLLALLAAFAFGAVHAVEPGHGKTLVAAYFVGVKGTVRQALGLGLIVAVTHTVGVLVIGTIAIFGSHWILPERLYPWLSLASGLMVMALGLRLIVSRGGGRILHRLSHLPLFGHRHDHYRQHKTPRADGVPPWRTLIGIGLADGLTPSPSALVVLLAAVSLHRIGLGIALIVAFSVGLAVVLAGISLGLLVFKQTMDAVSRRASSLNLPFVGPVAGAFSAEGAAMQALPLTGAVVLLVAGVALTVRALGAPGMSL
jgi:ABC-type nickel/cobalt efflux system permease component RcnA